VGVDSTTLFIVERRRNAKKPLYMALQGLLKAVYTKFRYHNANLGFLTDDKMRGVDRKVSLEEHLIYVQMVTSDYDSLMDNLVGLMKSLEMESDEIIDKETFTKHKQSVEEWEEKVRELTTERQGRA
jgi:hypothetical protein